MGKVRVWALQRPWLRHYTVVSPFFIKSPNLVFKRQCYNALWLGSLRWVLSKHTC